MSKMSYFALEVDDALFQCIFAFVKSAVGVDMGPS